MSQNMGNISWNMMAGGILFLSLWFLMNTISWAELVVGGHQIELTNNVGHRRNLQPQSNSIYRQAVSRMIFTSCLREFNRESILIIRCGYFSFFSQRFKLCRVLSEPDCSFWKYAAFGFTNWFIESLSWNYFLAVYHWCIFADVHTRFKRRNPI